MADPPSRRFRPPRKAGGRPPETGRRPLKTATPAGGSSSPRLRRVTASPAGIAKGAKGTPPESSAVAMLRAKTQKRLQLRQRMGLLSRKQSGDTLDATEKKMLDHELAIAEELQANLLPKRIPQVAGYDVSAYYRPSREVGGDYYDFIEIDNDHLGIIVADVSGKGIPGSIVMTETRALVKSEAVRTLSPAEALSRVNRVLYHDIKRGMFVTAFYAILSISKGIMTVISAGHNPMVLWRRAGNSCHLVNPNGLALGIDKGPLFEKTIKEQRLQLQIGDRFVLYTDGVTESMNPQNQQFGDNRFYLRVKQLGAKTSSEFLSQLIGEVESHQGTANQHDDITIVTARALQPQAAVGQPGH